MTDECIKFLNRFFINTVVDGFPVDTSLYNSGIFQFPEMLRYRRLCERFDLKPEECFFIDDIEANILGAASIGMQGIVFDGDYKKAQEALDELERSPRIL